MKKLSLNLGAGGLKGLLIQHVEKICLTVIGFLAAYFLYQGATLEGYQRGGPLQLQNTATNAESNLRKDSALTIMSKPERQPATDHLPRVLASTKATPIDSYPPYLLNPPLFSPKSKRTDPKLFAPEFVEVAAFRAAIYEKTTDPDAFADDPLAMPTKGPVRPIPPTSKTKTKANDLDALNQLEGRAPPKKKTTTKAGPPDGRDEMEAMRMGVPGMNMMAAAGGAVSPNYTFKYVHGMRPHGAVGEVRGVSRDFNLITALVPHAKYTDEFDSVLLGADGHDPLRDVPNYLMLNIERAVVGADPKAPPAWEMLSSRNLKSHILNVWAGVTPEVADERYVHPTLTFPMPPALMTDPGKLGLHSQVPRVKLKEAPKPDAAKGGQPVAPKPGNPNEPSEVPGDEVPNAGVPGLQRGLVPGMEMNRMQPGMEGMRGGPQNPNARTAEKMKHLLIRFYDFEVQRGVTYQYRVRILVEDPNRPLVATAAPSVQILDSGVVERLQKLDVYDAKQPAKASGAPHRTFYRESPWSEASQPVRMPLNVKYLVGPVQLTKNPIKIKDGGKEVEVNTEPIAGTLATSLWDFARATEVTGAFDVTDQASREKKPVPTLVFCGTVLNFFKDAPVLRPDTLQIHVVKDRFFRTNAFVVDMRVAVPTLIHSPTKGPKKFSPLTTPGEMLLVDHAGRLVVRNELDDLEDLRRLTFEGELKPPPAPAGGQ